MHVPPMQSVMHQVVPGGSVLLPPKTGKAAPPMQPMQLRQQQPQVNLSATNGAKHDLCAGLPDPETIRRQKEAYAKDLEEQLKRGVEMLGQAHKEQTELLHTSANQEKHRYNLAMDQQVKQQELLLSQQYNEQLMRLQQAAQQQRAELEQQACGLTLEYQQRKVQEEFMVQQAEIQKQHHDAQSRLATDMEKLGPPTTSGSSFNVAKPGLGACYAPPPTHARVAGVPQVATVRQYVPPGTQPPLANGASASSFSVPKPRSQCPTPTATAHPGMLVAQGQPMVGIGQRRSHSPLPGRVSGRRT